MHVYRHQGVGRGGREISWERPSTRCSPLTLFVGASQKLCHGCFAVTVTASTNAYSRDLSSQRSPLRTDDTHSESLLGRANPFFPPPMTRRRLPATDACQTSGRTFGALSAGRSLVVFAGPVTARGQVRHLLAAMVDLRSKQGRRPGLWTAKLLALGGVSRPAAHAPASRFSEDTVLQEAGRRGKPRRTRFATRPMVSQA